jgi:hypothetical protein
MERNELSRNIFRILDGEVLKDANKTHIVTNKILTLFEGWKSPEEEITCPDCGIKHKLKEFIW